MQGKQKAAPVGRFKKGSVGKYIGLEMLIENSKSEYYEALRSSSDGWHENENDLKPFVECLLGIVLKAYRELENRVEGVVKSRMGKSDRIRAVFDTTPGKVSKKAVLAKCPDISVAMAELTYWTTARSAKSETAEQRHTSETTETRLAHQQSPRSTLSRPLLSRKIWDKGVKIL